ncbi:MAG: bifunctional DNA-formamidopyrimidine glycosylase/DNA-(apurinic or apyrimidinic site) lyase [Alphaproteobacteria bacterium]|nr:bifunctional DNA-formamidopyrimidine glycosylase/DNA-(apurinic or apyrimidinic site) lyase [Alphaproteobacteria bacterium]
MPELPEVETVKRAIADHALGGEIKSVWQSGKTMRWPIPHDIEKQLTGLTILNLRRRGKYILMDCGNGQVALLTMIVHLGMSGSVRIYPKVMTPEQQKHDHLILTILGQRGEENTVVLNDPRRFGGVQITAFGEDDQHPLIHKMGVEPLGNAFSAIYMKTQFNGKTAPIKSALLDQRIIAGIGNIYASEALYLAGISPKRMAKAISLSRLEGLKDSVQQVLNQAIAAGGTSLRDHVQPGGEIGYFVQQLNVYGKDDQPCPQCQSPIKMIRQTGRASFYCPRCQR